MRKLYFLSTAICLLALLQATAQTPYLQAIPNGPNKKAMVMEQVGLTSISICYHRPGVNGREGKIWGQVVHNGFIKQGFGANNPSPWRAGANENTTIELSHDVKVEGKPLAKGKYALFIAYDPAESIIIFSRKHDAWGSFFYDEKDDVLRVRVKPQPLEGSVEWLRYEFSRQTQNSAVIALEWEKLAIPFTVEVDYLQQQFDAINADLKNPRGFTWESYNQAGAWCLANNYQLEQGLAWAKLSSDANGFGGGNSFTAISTTAQLLEKLGRGPEAAAEMKRALPMANMNELHQYARSLLQQKKYTEALAAFQLNHDKNPQQFTTLVGMARGLSATGNYKKALDFAQNALPLAPNEANKAAVQKMTEQLKAGKDIN